MPNTGLGPGNVKLKKVKCSSSSLEIQETKPSITSTIQEEEQGGRDRQRCPGSTDSTPKPEWKGPGGLPQEGDVSDESHIQHYPQKASRLLVMLIERLKLGLSLCQKGTTHNVHLVHRSASTKILIPGE